MFSYKETPENRTLEYECKECNIIKPITNFVISTTTYNTRIPVDVQYNKKYAYYDKTLPKQPSKHCEKCKCMDVSYIRKKNLQLILVCNNKECRNLF
jgi:hypothetical protein